jgi:hypothetical protein
MYTNSIATHEVALKKKKEKKNGLKQNSKPHLLKKLFLRHYLA